MSNIIDSIRMSGTTYAISDSGGTKVVEITQSDYDNLPTSAKTANIMYVITDAEPFDVSNYYTKDETSGATELATAFAATQPKLSAGTNITIVDNVISAEGGGGKAVSGGTNISITTGETADTINCTLPLSAGSNDYSVVEGQYCIASGYYSHAEGQRTTASTTYSHAAGFKTKTSNIYEFVIGKDNVSNKANTTFGNSGNTLFAVGNGGDYGMNPYHNAFEVRQNGDIYIADTNDTSTSNFYEKPMIKLQDALGGGGIDSGTVQTMIDQSISGKTNQTDFVSHSGNTTMHVTESEKSTWNAKSDFSGNYNDLSNKPTIPTSASQLTNDSGYITSSALNGYATEAYVTAATNDMATKTWVGQQGYLTQHQDISGKQDVSGMTAYTTTATTNTLSGTVTAHTADTTIHVTAQDKTNWDNKSDFSGSYNDLTNKLSAGTNITIVDNVISAEGGGGGKAVSGGTNISITTGETADTINCTLPITATSNVFNTISVGEGSRGGTYNTLIGPNARCDNNGGHNVFLVAQNSSNSASGAYVNGTHNVIIGSMKNGYLNFNIPSFSTSQSVVIGGGEMSTDKNNSLAIGYNANVSGTTKTNINNQLKIDTSNQVYIYNKDNTEMICLQDQLGGGGSSYTAGDGIDITNDVISVSGVVMSSAITTSVTSSSTDSQIPSAKAVNDKLGGLSIVKLTQSEYDSLATKDNSTLYVIVN